MKITIEFGYEFMDQKFWLTVLLIANIHFFVTLYICERLIIQTWWVVPWLYRFYMLIWIPFFMFTFWYLLVEFPIGQGWIMKFFYYRFQYRIIDISFTWFWDPFYTFLEWITGGYRTKLYRTWEHERNDIYLLKEGCDWYREIIMDSFAENLNIRKKNLEHWKYWFGERKHGVHRQRIKNYANLVFQMEVLMRRHERFLFVIESFADDAIKRKRPVNPKILRGALRNLNREFGCWKITYRTHKLGGYFTTKEYFGPQLPRTDLYGRVDEWLWVWFYDLCHRNVEIKKKV